MATETRLDRVEANWPTMTSRLRRLERDGAEAAGPTGRPETGAGAAGRPRAARALPAAPPAARGAATSPPPLRPPSTALDFEALFGGRVLAWIGGLAILFAAVLFVGMAVSRGWIDEETRTIIAAVASLGAARRRRLAARARGPHRGRPRRRRRRARRPLRDDRRRHPGLRADLARARPPPRRRGRRGRLRRRGPLGRAGDRRGRLARRPGGADPGRGRRSRGGIAFVASPSPRRVVILLWRRWDWLALGAFAVSAPQLFVWVNCTSSFERPSGGRRRHRPAAAVGFWVALRPRRGRLRAAHARRDARAAVLLLAAPSSAAAPSSSASATDGSMTPAHHAAAVVVAVRLRRVHVALGELAIRLGSTARSAPC